MQTLLSYVVVSSDDSNDTSYQLPRSVLSLIGMESPVNAVFTGVFGVRSNSTFMSYLSKELNLERNQTLCPVGVEIDVELNATKYNGLKDGGVLIRESNVLNTLRLRADLAKYIQAEWRKCGAAARSKVDERFPTTPTSVPHYIDILRSSDNFPHLDLIVYQVQTPAGKIAVASAYIQPFKLSPWMDLEAKIEL